MDNRDVLRGVGRAFGGALLLVVPLLMTMDMWSHALAMPRYRLGLLVLATVALALELSHYFGFLREEAVSWGTRRSTQESRCSWGSPPQQS